MGKKEEHCNPAEPADAEQGDNWDHVALDPEHRLVVSVIPGKRTVKNTERLVADFKRRTGGRLMNLMTSDEYKPYKKAILKAYGRAVPARRRQGSRGRPRLAHLKAPRGLHYAVVHKTRRKGRVVKIAWLVIYGTVAAVLAALGRSLVSRMINTAFIERHNATDRQRNGRKRRKTYCFSKDWQMHEAVTYFCMFSYNFCWPVRTLRQQVGGRWQARTPAMAAGLTDHVWPLREWLVYPAVQRA